jgi:hypothetical protein
MAGAPAVVPRQPLGEGVRSATTLTAVVVTDAPGMTTTGAAAEPGFDLEHLQPLVGQHDGRSLLCTAEEARFVFPRGTAAVKFALVLQARPVAARASPPVAAPRRVAIHLAEMRTGEAPVAADAPDRLATAGRELLRQAAPGAVCLTAGVLEAAGAELPGRPAFVGTVRLAGHADPVGVYQVFPGVTAGLCPQCGYDLRGVPHRLCPECGRDVGAPALADARVPWERRHETGAFRAFWATVALASFRPVHLARRVTHGGSLPAAGSFQALCRLLAVLSLLHVALMTLPVAAIILSFEGFLGTTPDPVRVMVLRVVIGACVAMVVGCLVAAPVVARLQRRARQATNLASQRAAVAHCYASGPLALYPVLAAVALGAYAYGYFGGSDLERRGPRALLVAWAAITALHVASHVVAATRAARQ